MKIQFPLYAKLVAVFLLNVAVLLSVAACFFSTKFNLGWEALLYSPIGERVQKIAFVIGKQIRAQPSADWDKILLEFGEFYGVRFFLFDSAGMQLAGEPITLPPNVIQRVKEPVPFFKQCMGPPAHALRTGANAIFPMTAQGSDGRTPSGFAKSGAVSQGWQMKGHSVALSMDSFSHISAMDSTSTQGPNILTPGPLLWSRPPGRFFVHTKNPDTIWIGAFIFAEKRDGMSKREPGTLLAVTPNLWQTKLMLDFGHLLLVGLVILFISLLVWWPFIYGISSALKKLTSTTEKIAEGKFGTTLEMRRHDEIGRLAQAINIMSSRLSMYDLGQKRFLGDIAHELCSPIARLQVAIELLQPSISAEQHAALEDIREEVEQMRLLINELLAFSKAGITGKELQLTAVNLSKLLEKITSKGREDGAIKLDCQADLECLGDTILLERAFGNILRNAERYAAGSGPVLVSTNCSDLVIAVKFTDNGPGVPPESLELLGQPFYRPEPSRNRSTGGTGLGLAIVKACIEACDGSVILQNRHPTGLEVEVKLKAKTIPLQS